MKLLLIFFFSFVQICHSQDLSAVELTKEDKNKKVQYHYQWESTGGHVAIIDLYLFRDHNYIYSIGSNVYSSFSTGHWQVTKDTIILNSNIQKNTLPIRVSYRQRDNNDFNVKRIAFLKDLNGNQVNYAFIYINNDSTYCDYGDFLCIGNYSSIDSIRVRIENYGIYSPWIRIRPFDGLLQVILETNQSLKNYIVFDDKRYWVNKNKLRLHEN